MREVFYEVGTGKPASLPVFHTVVTGITQHGKTETLKSMIRYVNSQGFTVLVMDIKDKTIGRPDFTDFPQIPIYLKEVTEPLPLLGLLESDSKMQLKFQFPELIKACQKAKGLKDIRDRLVEVIEGGRIHPVRKDKAEVLRLLLDRLIEEIGRVRISSKPEVKAGKINVMTLANRGFSDAFKQLVVRTMIQHVRLHMSDIVVFFDEAHIQVPEGYSSASKDWIVKTIKEGASSRQFLVIADQTLKEVDKDVVTQCPLKVFGGQAGGRLEAQRTLEYMPVKEGITMDSIMRLPLGHFYVCTREWSKLCYVLPQGVPEEVAVKVAKGELKPEHVQEHFMVKKEEGDEEVWKERYEELKGEHEELTERCRQIEKQLEAKGAQLRDQIKSLVEEETKALTEEISKKELKIRGLDEERERLRKDLADCDAKMEKLWHTDEEIRSLEEFKTALASLTKFLPIPKPAPESFPARPIDLEHVEVPISVSHEEKPLKVNTESKEGKVLYAVICMDEKGRKQPDWSEGKGWTETEIGEEMQEHGWNLGREVRFTLGSMVKDGLLVTVGERPVRYRLPKYRMVQKEA